MDKSKLLRDQRTRMITNIEDSKWQDWDQAENKFTLSLRRAVRTCCSIGRINLRGKGENLFCLRKSYKFCSSISKTRHVWFLCWKPSKARTKLNSSAFSWASRDKMPTWESKDNKWLLEWHSNNKVSHKWQQRHICLPQFDPAWHRMDGF